MQHLVVPKLPTVLHDQAAVELPGYDLWLAYVDNVHVIPGVIELESRTNALLWWPLIELTNSGVPLDVSYEQERPLSSVLQNDYVLQEDLSPLLSCHSDGADIVDKERPLLCLKLTFFEEETCIGVSWHHALGLSTISLYQCKLPEFPSFTFKKHDFPPPSDEIATRYHDKIRHLHDPYPSAELGAAFFEANAGVQNLQWRFSGEELRRLRVMVSESGYQALSTQDCLTAYIVTVFNLVQEKPIRIVTNVCNYRGVSAPFIEENVAGNAFSNAITDRLPVDIAGIASAIHMSIIRTRDAQYLKNYLSVAGDRMLNQANLGKVFLFPPHDDVIVGNSNAW
ncbi:hypothetical protein M404DRAFT_9320 [Pisolithus tinctorius Marx 270]|uniref:Condensation domain-containing protein n=1 Tax=Pisolithus tinctorius Marx 270 TaxID=870435 RepID=A0A0C3K424_PISTI|nr:hypothetical protein M404DRAFT_9320 [Pisolithus tinctorius Marx 270]